MTDKNNPAMPCESPLEIYSGLTAQEYAAIHLKVADSGTPWLDEMIEKARRDELANQAPMVPWNFAFGDVNGNPEKDSIKIQVKWKYFWADLMLAASKEEK